jgi:hypothetical protein
MKKAKNKINYRTTPKTTQSEDTYSIEESAIDTFLLLSKICEDRDTPFSIQFYPAFLKDLSIEIEELKRLRDQILR